MNFAATAPYAYHVFVCHLTPTVLQRESRELKERVRYLQQQLTKLQKQREGDTTQSLRDGHSDNVISRDFSLKGLSAGINPASALCNMINNCGKTPFIPWLFCWAQNWFVHSFH